MNNISTDLPKDGSSFAVAITGKEANFLLFFEFNELYISSIYKTL